ncbi:CHASE2 domain-containing protein [Rhodobacterales bacterium]|nr:CHASE2 domain-containing protein [Rhodobacterales bacterium]
MILSGRFADLTSERKRLIVLIALLAVTSGILLGLSAKKAVWEGWLIDRLFQIRALANSGAGNQVAPIVVIGLDQISLDSDQLTPFPRVLMTPVFAKAGQAVLDAGARAVGYDFVFAYNADDFVFPGTDEARLQGFDTEFKKFLYRNRGKVFLAHTEVGVPHRGFTGIAGEGGVRSVLISTDSDGVVRRHIPETPLENSPKLIDALLSALGSDVSVPYTAVPQARVATSVPYLSMIDVLEMTETEAGRAALSEFVEGKGVLFGTMLAYEDEHLYSDRFLPHTPAEVAETGVSGRPGVRSQTSGVMVLADLIGAGLTGRTAVDPPPGVLPVVAVVFAVAGALAGFTFPMMVLPIIAVTGALVGLGGSYAALNAGFLLSPGVAPVACISAMVISAVGKVGVLQRKQRALVRLFGHYLAPDVIRQMARSEQLPALGGETRHVVVAFIDIAGFTKMSESLPDQEVVRVVNSCFDAIGQVITAHEGYIDKYIGDAIMAVWNAPNTVENPEKAAVDSACEIVRLLEQMREETGQTALDLRVALNAGPVLVGDIGGEHRRSFTVMGTTVNTASRIESVAKDHKVRLAFSQTLAEKLPSSYPLKELWTGQLRGLSNDTSVYTLDLVEMYMEEPSARAQDTLKKKGGGLLTFSRKRSV